MLKNINYLQNKKPNISKNDAKMPCTQIGPFPLIFFPHKIICLYQYKENKKLPF